MKIVCIGGGPAGLYFAILMKLQNPDNHIVVLERNKPYDTFGWGVVFSDATMENLAASDPVSASEIKTQFTHWDDIDVHFKNEVVTSSGHGFIGIGRKNLLNLLQKRCEDLGVELVFECNVDDDNVVVTTYQPDLIVACNGINSPVRTKYAKTYQPDIDERKCRFVWLGTKKVFESFSFIFVETEFGWFQAHAYQFEDGLSTFIVETREETWQAAGIDKLSKEEGVAYCESLFAPWLDGEPLISNADHLRGSAIWIRFPRIICENWVHWQTYGNQNSKPVPVVLMGDAAHTAHFSIGSGTKLALEDAIELSRSLATTSGDLQAGLQHYSKVRSIEVLKIQNAARNSTDWFENIARYAGMEPQQFNYSLLTRSQRISHENLRIRDAKWLKGFELWFAQHDNIPESQVEAAVIPALTPYKLAELRLENRIVFSPTLIYSARDGKPNDTHLVHLGSRAMGGAGLVFTEMTAVSPEARTTPGCTGLWNDEQQAAWKHIVDFVHENSVSKIGIQLGHCGRKGSTQVGWENPEKPLNDGNWPLISASELPYLPGVSATPTEATETQLTEICKQFSIAAARAMEAGFDWLELQAGQGYLLSSFISPLTNQRSDKYGGSLENRLRFPLQVLTSVRKVWPANLPLSVRISSTDWAEGGIDVDDSIEISRYLQSAGADMITVSSGEVVPTQKPVYGRMYQTPMADRIRNEVGVPVMAVGAITSLDQVDSVIASGRADLCALARPLLANPAWLLHQVAHYPGQSATWPLPYLAGKDQLLHQVAPNKIQKMGGKNG
ncbi:bifunctional salicylyl-CoA 5-hydroxylase/oxidoreductase [Aestuariicella hydrocarbonica]|uniref:Bifunctional salicylyl-CoA 5-hydroxylase/oxidoreductase n=1 Tax=Pseudomaricurvus hydrocarbonicus TaxID=1470433 RepID=A0A9E5T2F5_9GAMM|nr:bifunctional salicylyl-CoA 5-hydroxylase/oxidoreductase [Aestuariicella hydrocarbonica]NHO68385.1 bifunctional salicylyl-CoA 5-hydroxylase/oxidoreductase [Aestuariicella hydrocarbonica]